MPSLGHFLESMCGHACMSVCVCVCVYEFQYAPQMLLWIISRSQPTQSSQVCVPVQVCIREH